MTIPELVFFWVTLALVNAGLAQAKNRTGLNWFLLGLCFGPGATFDLLVLPKLDPKPTPSE